MKKSHFLGAVCVSIAAVFAAPVSAVTVDYSSQVGSSVDLDPTDGCGGGTVGCFSFSAGNNIVITSGTASGFAGGITGLFGVDTITSGGGVESASVSGTGTLTIFDGATTLIADLTWIDIATYGTAGILNTFGAGNLSNITYSGTNPDLVALATAGSGVDTASFQFTTPTTLTDIFTTSTTVTHTSFSGSIAAVPVPAAVWLFGSGLLGLAGLARRKGAA